MKKIVYSILIATSLLSNVSCDNNFEEINTSPNQASTTDPNLLLSYSIIQTQENMYNIQIGGDMGLCWAQHWSKVQYNDEERYVPRRAVMNALWNGLYTNVINEATEASVFAAQSGNTNLQAAALIMKANAFQILTDVYGPIPFTQAIDPAILKPAYDSQEVVYDGILGLLNQAETLLASGTGTITPSADKLYGGNVSKWRKLANSLKLKALMRISNKRNVSADVAALVAAGNLMTSNADSAQLVYTAIQPDANPIYEGMVNPSFRDEYKVSSVLIAALNATSDPRLDVYAKKNTGGLYVGNNPGEENAANYGGFSSPGAFYLNPTLPGVVLSYSQVEFLLAEATLKGYLAAGDLDVARGHYFEGIKANLNFNNVPFATSTTFLANPALDFGSVSAGLQKIGEQNWLALYGQGIEAWTEWRRTGYPALSIAAFAAPGQTTIPSRFYYSTDENSFNQASYQAAVATLSQGDTMMSKVWWMN
jgi:hypothetical protein